jgi:hypothetical protein
MPPLNDNVALRSNQRVRGTVIQHEDGSETHVLFAQPVSPHRALRLRDEALKMVSRGEEPVGLF